MTTLRCLQQGQILPRSRSADSLSLSRVCEAYCNDTLAILLVISGGGRRILLVLVDGFSRSGCLTVNVVRWELKLKEF